MQSILHKSFAKKKKKSKEQKQFKSEEAKKRDAENGTCPLDNEDDKLVHVLLKSNETKEVRTVNDNKLLHANGEMAHKEITSRKKKTQLKNGGKFLGAFAKLRKATIGFVTPVRLSAWKNSAPTGRIFIKFDNGGFFENLLRKFKLN